MTILHAFLSFAVIAGLLTIIPGLDMDAVTGTVLVGFGLRLATSPR